MADAPYTAPDGVADDDWTAGYRLAVDLRGSRLAREALLKLEAAVWSAETLRGFVDGHEHMLNLATCTCTHCPIHRDHVVEVKGAN